MNEQLIVLQNRWDTEIVTPYVQSHPYILSRPFSYGVSQEFQQAKHKLMVIGQEAAGFSVYEDGWDLPRTQQWAVDYLRLQLWDIHAGGDEGNKKNNSPFWRLLREFDSKGIIPSWNNVDKVYRWKKDNKVHRLFNEQRKLFCGAIDACGTTLLQQEIVTVKPDAILFVTGPYYQHSMQTSLKLLPAALDQKRPTKQDPCTNITEQAQLGIPCFWSYHPAYLSRIGAFYSCVDMVLRALTE